MIKEFQGEYRFLSNFWPCGILFNNETFPTVEHAYQAAKIDARKVNLWTALRSCDYWNLTPGQAKRIGKKFPLRSDWEDVKIYYMYRFVRQKFEDTKLRELLNKTKGQDLQEGNYWGDEFWGVNLKNGKGKNMLGRILMAVRDGNCCGKCSNAFGAVCNDIYGGDGLTSEISDKFWCPNFKK